MEKKREKLKKNAKKIYDIAVEKNLGKILFVILIIAFLFMGIWIRTLGISNLKDVTSGEYIPLALDPFYFLRVAETMINYGALPEVDVMRYPSLKIGFTNEILPSAIVFMYKCANLFIQVDLRYIDIISPIILFALGFIVFFFLTWVLTKSKTASLVSAGLLAIIPSYLYRTMAGFADHEAIGMFAFFSVMLGYIFSLKFLDSNKKSGQKQLLLSCLFGVGVAFLSVFTMASWGGIAVFVPMIIPLSFVVLWLVKVQNLEENKQGLLNFILFYILWLSFMIIFGSIFNLSYSSIISRYILSTYGLGSLFVLGFIVVDYILIKVLEKKNFLGTKDKYRVLYSAGILILIGAIFISFTEGLLNFISDIFYKLLHPFGTERVGLTIAENKQPYLSDWISTTGVMLFWMFYFGLIAIGLDLASKIRMKKNKILFSLAWIIMISGILFSRISGDSLLNGDNFISKIILAGGLLLFGAYCIKIYFQDKIQINAEFSFIFAWTIFMLISARSAVRIFFAITPFVCFAVGYLIIKLKDSWIKTKDELLKMILAIFFVIAIISLLVSANAFSSSVVQQAKYTGPSANYQWQKAMNWVKENTDKKSIFVHWWDYGYWVQYLGQRPSVTDGGHANGFWDHLIGRYVLTTPYPETALSFMKAHNVSYLLIDPSDLGKYSAYSSIGSDEKGDDRYSWIPVMTYDKKQMIETRNGTLRFYNAGTWVDKDIIYKKDGKEIFLPAQKAVFAGAFVEELKGKGFGQPMGIFVYNNQQIKIPLRYLYFEHQLIDFEEGINAIIRIIPSLDTYNGGIKLDYLGAAIYLSPKVSESLFSQLYLMNDPLNKYPTLKLKHAEQDQIVEGFNNQGANLGEFIYYNGFRGPIKIWEINYPENIIARKEFLRESGKYAEFDNLQFIR